LRGGTLRVVLEKLATIPMLDVRFPTTHDCWRVISRYTQREADQILKRHELRLSLPPRLPPRIKLSEQVAAATSPLRMSFRPWRSLCLNQTAYDGNTPSTAKVRRSGGLADQPGRSYAAMSGSPGQ